MTDWDQHRENLKIVYFSLVTITFFVLLMWVFTDISSPHGQEMPRAIGLLVLAIEVMVLAWFLEKGREMIK